MKIYHTVYKITNHITKKYYIGAHTTSNLDDGYMGSGVYLKRAQLKYGIENFSKEVLHICDSEEEMFQQEKNLVEVGERTYNVMEGGCGGWSYARSKITKETHKKVSDTMKTEEYRHKTKHLREASSKRIKKLHDDPKAREKQKESLKRKMNDPEWIDTVGKERARKISETMKQIASSLMTDERNKKVADAMRGRICITFQGKKMRVKQDDPILNNPEIILGWKNTTNI